MTDDIWDTIIVGQGLAGTTLAWRLVDAGQRVLMFDPAEAVTSSKIAAGLITPITGQRLALSWRVNEFLAVARAFYASIEQRTGQRFFYERRAVRLLQSVEERMQWAKRAGQPAYQAFLSEMQPEPLIASEVAGSDGGGFEMRAAQLDVAAYLAASRGMLPNETAALDWSRDVVFETSHISVLGHRCRRLISCEGFAASRNPFFPMLQFKAAKGEILTVRFHAPMPERTLHCGIWIAPTAEADVFRVGATYDWERLDQVPTVAARAELEGKLRALVRVPFTVLDHHAAVRPIIYLSEAVMGLHPTHERLGVFNGLGSKGSLHAPWFAKCFADLLIDGAALPDEVDLRKRTL
ncbi:MAG: FAD-dependent oxidoreductase [Hyphomicrobiaceae bacterium]|nr:FAD-binding oxidoreductase [Hyphomicrobiaceae bacterium]